MSGPADAFTLAEVEVALPKGAVSGAHRRILRHKGRPLFGLTQGRFRACFYPVFSPAGYLLTSESPSDHPHHNSIWAAADHVHARVEAAGGKIEEYAYNFYVDDVFQGRAPGRILGESAALSGGTDDSVRLTQQLEWRGPREWGAPDGRLVLNETRQADVRILPDATVIDLTSTLSPAEWAVTIGPSRHWFFNMRAADSIALAPEISSDRGAVLDQLPSPSSARWIDIRGPVGGGHAAGLAMQPHPDEHPALSWFVTDWGVATARPRMDQPLRLRRGENLRLRCRYVLHDAGCDLAALFALPYA